MRKIWRIAAGIILLAAGIFALLAGILTITEYRPEDTETIVNAHDSKEALALEEPFSIVIWNCGYGALGDNADFFMDGGTHVYTSDVGRVNENLAGMKETLQSMHPDFVLLQEVDIHSARSYGIDEREVLRTAVEHESEAFAYNYNSLFVPYPIPPIGHVEGGLLTISNKEIMQADRIALPCPFSWPTRVANLKRCLLVSRFSLKGTDKELVLVNLHLEAYDSGEGKAAQTAQLAALLKGEAEKGNYIVAGGDFNQGFSNVDSSMWPVHEGMWKPGLIEPEAFGDSFSLIMDASVPTCRSLDRPYAGAADEDFQFYMIDGFIVSENVQVDLVKTHDRGFVFSDHNPVHMVCSLKAQE